MDQQTAWKIPCLAAACSVLLPLGGAWAQVTRRVPSQFATIQAAIAAASDGDTVLVANGMYLENLDFLGKAITVESEGGPQLAIIDGNQVGRVVVFTSGEDRRSVLRGFTIRNGLVQSFMGGGGILIQESSPTIENNIITANAAESGGAGIQIFIGSPLVRGNTISQNTLRRLSAGGGGIHASGSGAEIVDNVISGNSAGRGNAGRILIDATSVPAARARVTGNVIQGNSAQTAGGIFVRDSASALIAQNLIVGNSAVAEGGALLLNVDVLSAGLLLLNNTIADNQSPTSTVEGRGVAGGAGQQHHRGHGRADGGELRTHTVGVPLQ